MASSSVFHLSSFLPSTPFIISRGSRSYPARNSSRRRRKPHNVMAMCSDSKGTSSSPPSPLKYVLDFPRVMWKQTLKPLSDFGFGRRSIWEGGIGLFLLSGVFLLAFTLAWLRGFQLRSKFKKYSTIFEFEKASGICTGTPVRIRGVNVGSVLRVNPSLKNIEAIIEIEDDKVIIPLNSLIEVNQSGLLMESMIDITPRDPLPSPSFGPLSDNCVNEGLILCDKQRLKGSLGVSLDDLVAIYTRIGREMDAIGVSNSYSLAQRVAEVIEEAKPLLIKMRTMADEVQPMLAEMREGGLVREVESLTKSLTQASDEMRVAHRALMTPDNTELIQKSVHSLIFTLKNIESISSDILGFTGDEATRRNLKALIKALSRML